MKNKLRAFTLVEMSVVIVIIGLLIVAIASGKKYIISSQINNAISLTQKSPVGSISSLALWLETSNEENFNYKEANNGANITLWKDINPQAATKNDVSRAASDSKITYAENVINGLPAIYFDGTATDNANYLQGNAVAGLGNKLSFFIVYKLNDTSTSSVRTIVRNGYPSTGWAYKEVANLLRTNTIYPSTDMKGSAMSQDWEIVSTIFNNATLSTYINGVAQTLDVNTATAITSTSYIYIGGIATQAWKGYVAEIIIFNDELSDDDRKEIEKYLSKKYSIKITQ